MKDIVITIPGELVVIVYIWLVIGLINFITIVFFTKEVHLRSGNTNVLERFIIGVKHFVAGPIGSFIILFAIYLRVAEKMKI